MALRQVKSSIDDNEFITILSLVFNQKMEAYPRSRNTQTDIQQHV